MGGQGVGTGVESAPGARPPVASLSAPPPSVSSSPLPPPRFSSVSMARTSPATRSSSTRTRPRGWTSMEPTIRSFSPRRAGAEALDHRRPSKAAQVCRSQHPPPHDVRERWTLKESFLCAVAMSLSRGGRWCAPRHLPAFPPPPPLSSPPWVRDRPRARVSEVDHSSPACPTFQAAGPTEPPSTSVEL